MASNSKTWTDERVEFVRKSHAEGFSASQISNQIGIEFNVTISRNAVIGIIHRKGWGRGFSTGMRAKIVSKARAKQRASREAQQANRDKLKQQHRTNPKAVAWRAEPWKSNEPELVIPLAERKTIETLEANHCRWPIGDVGQKGFHFCGKNREAGVPYCGHHARIAFLPVAVRRPSYADLPIVAPVEVKTKVDA